MTDQSNDDAFAVLGAVMQHNYVEAAEVIRQSQDPDLLAIDLASYATAAICAHATELGVTPERYFQALAQQRLAS